jgi:hypothetical protein
MGPWSTADVAASVKSLSARHQAGVSRRIVVALLIVFGGMLGSMSSFVPSVAAGSAATVIADGAPLLAGVDDFTVIDYMEYGARVDVLYGPHDGLYEILYNGVHGWTWDDKLDVDGGGGEATSSSSDESSSEASASGPTEVSWWGSASWVVVDTDFLNVRGDAGTWADVWDVYPGGTWVAVVGESVNGYAPIEYGDSVAWIAEQYISWDGSTSWDIDSSSAGVGGSSSDVPAGDGEHWIDIDRSSGLVTLYIGDVPQATYWASLSRDTSADGFYTTALGTWYVTRKYEPLAFTKYANAYITEWVAFDESRDNGFHSYMKDASGNILPNGAGFTGGCVALNPEGAAAVFDFAYVGMRIEVHL